MTMEAFQRTPQDQVRVIFKSGRFFDFIKPPPPWSLPAFANAARVSGHICTDQMYFPNEVVEAIFVTGSMLRTTAPRLRYASLRGSPVRFITSALTTR